MNNEQHRQIAYWVELLLDENLPKEEFQQLEQLISSNSDARELYLDLMYQHAQLQLAGSQLEAMPIVTTRRDDNDRAVKESGHQTRGIKRTAWYSAVALCASLLFAIWWNWSPPKDDLKLAIAEISDASNARWEDCTLPTAVGSSLEPGRLKLARGLATIHFSSGAEVTMEAPADFQIDSALGGRLNAGTLVVEVPESAHGFTIATPNAEAIDHGTAFAVAVDPASLASSIEVIEGEVEVKHSSSNESMRLVDRQRVVANEDTLISKTTRTDPGDEFETIHQESRQTPTVKQITTAMGNGWDATVSRGDVTGHTRSDLILIKSALPGYESFTRKAYLRFDLGSLAGKQFTAARFTMALQPSGLGLASRLPDSEFAVYGLTDESLDHWDPKVINWSNAPAIGNDSTDIDSNLAQELGRFTVPRGKQHGTVSIDGNRLLEFLKLDSNNLVTLIVVRITRSEKAGGLVHGFANRFNSSAPAPALHITTEENN